MKKFVRFVIENPILLFILGYAFGYISGIAK
jgi:hypothetical protein